jgi:hypothetical protein
MKVNSRLKTKGRVVEYILYIVYPRKKSSDYI